ncbi:MAG: hypothetical protein K1X64_22200 [Myxococcaceae bacterium]|nr:hypothetical protein [Myxococcaceae bacterium]
MVAEQVHFPLLQEKPGPQALLHAPQWSLSQSRLAHLLPHSVLPLVHPQEPLTQGPAQQSSPVRHVSPGAAQVQYPL